MRSAPADDASAWEQLKELSAGSSTCYALNLV